MRSPAVTIASQRRGADLGEERTRLVIWREAETSRNAVLRGGEMSRASEGKEEEEARRERMRKRVAAIGEGESGSKEWGGDWSCGAILKG